MCRRSQAEPVRVVIADDHAVLREPLRAWLAEEPGFAVVGEAADGAEAVRLAGKLRPDVLLLDWVMPGMDGVEVVKEVRALAPATRIVVLTAYADQERARALIGVGVSGYVCKTTRLADMVRAVRAVHDGDVWFKAAASRPPDRVFAAPPSGRQLQVLRLVEEGHQDGEIARLLHVSRWTVRFHLKNLFGKLNASSRTEAIHVARRHGWLGGPPLQ